MGRYAIVKNGKVTAVVLSDAAPGDGILLVPHSQEDKAVEEGWGHDGTRFTPPPPSAAFTLRNAPDAQVVTMKTLRDLGLL